MKTTTLLSAALLASTSIAAAEAQKPMNTAEVIKSAKPGDWRALDPEYTLYMTLPGGTVVLELAPHFAPETVANIKTLARQHYYDNLAVVRSQDNYVAQWGDPAEEEALQKSTGKARTSIPPEYERAAAGLDYQPLPGPDGFADDTGFSRGFAAARKGGKAWLSHCYGALGVGRGMAPDSGTGASLYVVTGHAPRHLDRNITIAGRVISGMELLSALPRGTGQLGFYKSASEHVPVISIRLGTEVPAKNRFTGRIMRTDSDAFRRYIDARANRARDGWFVKSHGFVDLCNVAVPLKPGKGS